MCSENANNETYLPTHQNTFVLNAPWLTKLIKRDMFS